MPVTLPVSPEDVRASDGDGNDGVGIEYDLDLDVVDEQAACKEPRVATSAIFVT